MRVVLRAVAAAGISLLVLPAVGSAHALVVSSSPSASSVLTSPPVVVEATFSEPLDRSLSELTLETAAGRPVRAVPVGAAPATLVVHPLERLPRGVYRVRWHSVSAEDGHTANGTYAFSVGTRLTGAGSHGASVAAGGWPAVLVRCAFDGALIVFCGGIFCSALLAPARTPGGWMLASGRFDRESARLWRLTVLLGIGAVLLSAAVALQDAARATGGLGVDSLRRYFIGGSAGLTRMAVTVALVASVIMTVRRAPRYASVFAIAALAAVVVGGHARSAHLPAVAMTSDVAHLAAASVWIGGIVHLVIAWVLRVPTLSVARRREALQVVLPRFGRLALRAFAVLATAGTVTAATELPSVAALWADGYGRTLIVKGGLVVAIASVSYVHAFRLRPRIIASSAYGSALERRHWRLLAAQAPLAAGVMIAAAWLVVTGPPPASGPSQATSGRATTADQLSVAGQAGPYIVNAVIGQRPSRLNVELHTFDALEHPVASAVRVANATSERRCGLGCVRLTLARPRAVLTLTLIAHGRTYHASLPIRFVPGSARLAARLLSEIANASRHLKSVTIRETLGSGTGAVDLTNYQLRAPNEFAYRLVRAGHTVSDTVIIGSRQWMSEAGARRWTAGDYGGGRGQFSTGGYLAWWTPYATRPLLLSISWAGSDERADVATTGQVAGLGTVWLRLRIDVGNQRVLRIRMITVDHFMTQTWSGFNVPVRVRPPTPTN